MKKFILSIGAALSLIACNQVPSETAGTAVQQQVQQPLTDTAGLSSFREWKVQNELADIGEYQAQQSSVAQAPKTVAKKRTAAPVRQSAPVSRPVEQPQSGSSSSDNSSTANSDAGSGSTGTAGTGTGEETAKKKEGWSKAAKGAVIGGVAGAAGGAVINKKNRVVGAVVGAVIGAGGGYAIGRGMDKKDGRIEMQ